MVDDKDASSSDDVTVEVQNQENNAQQTDTTTNQQTDTDTTNQQTDTDTTNQQTDTDTTNQQTDTDTTNQQTDTDTTNQQTDTDTTNQQTDTDTTNQQTDTTEQTTVEDQVKENVAPKADAGDDQNAEVNTEVKLDGSKSSDDDGQIVSYKWEQTDGPKVDLKQSDEKTASFDVPESAADSKLSFKLTVVDDKDASSSDDVTVDVKEAQNVSPKADAGNDQNAEVNTEVKLDGSKSSDEDGEIVSYKWEQTDGSEVNLKQR